MSITTDNWKTSKVGLGEFDYYNPKTQQMEKGFGLIASQIVGGLMLTEEIGIYNQNGTMTMDQDGLNITNGINSFSVNPNSSSLLTIKKGDVSVFSVSDTGELTFTGNVTANDLVLGTNGLHESNAVTGISISPKDVSILTLRKGKEKVLYFNDSGDLQIKANIVATGLELPDNVNIDITNNPALKNYIKKDTVIGQTPNQNTTGFIVSKAGKMQASDAILYNTEIYTNFGNIAGFIVGDGYLRNGNTSNKYFGMNSNTTGVVFHAGSENPNGSDGIFRVTNDGHLYSSHTTIEDNGFEILNHTGEKSLWFSNTDRLCISDSENQPSSIVMSDENTEIKIIVNQDNLEFWINSELFTQIPKA